VRHSAYMISKEVNSAGSSYTRYPRTPALRYIYYFLLFYPIAWILGTSFFYFHLISLTLVLLLFSQSTTWNIQTRGAFPAILLSAYVFVYLLSIVINSSGSSVTRIAAAYYNLSVWTVGIVAFFAGLKINRLDARPVLGKVAVSMFATLAIAGAIVWLFWYFGGIYRLAFNTPVWLIVERYLPYSLIQSSATLSLIEPDWRFGNLAPRTAVLGPYATATAATFLIFLPFYLSWRPPKLPIRCLKWLVCGLAVMAFWFAFSRAALVILLVSTIIILLTSRRWIQTGAGILVIMLCIISLPFLGIITASFVEIRTGSSEQRFQLYEYQTEEVYERSPVIGLGVKERIGPFDVPLGSHSTYLGAIYKTGFLGGILVLGFQLVVLGSWIIQSISARSREDRSVLRQYGFAILSIMLWMTGEDIDAPQLVSFVYFFLCGGIFSNTRSPKFKFSGRQ